MNLKKWARAGTLGRKQAPGLAHAGSVLAPGRSCLGRMRLLTAHGPGVQVTSPRTHEEARRVKRGVSMGQLHGRESRSPLS